MDIVWWAHWHNITSRGGTKAFRDSAEHNPPGDGQEFGKGVSHTTSPWIQAATAVEEERLIEETNLVLGLWLSIGKERVRGAYSVSIEQTNSADELTNHHPSGSRVPQTYHIPVSYVSLIITGLSLSTDGCNVAVIITSQP